MPPLVYECVVHSLNQSDNQIISMTTPTFFCPFSVHLLVVQPMKIMGSRITDGSHLVWVAAWSAWIPDQAAEEHSERLARRRQRRQAVPPQAASWATSLTWPIIFQPSTAVSAGIKQCVRIHLGCAHLPRCELCCALTARLKVLACPA